MTHRNFKIALAMILVVGMPLHSKATTQAPSGEVLTPSAVRELERSAKTASDHERLADYYRSQAQQAQKNLADAEELLKKWGPAERASKVPDPYPHARRLVSEYSAQAEKYSKLAANHEKAARKLEAGGNPNPNRPNDVTPKQ
jgi:Skp family chaperone for outer membrane proteins